MLDSVCVGKHLTLPWTDLEMGTWEQTRIRPHPVHSNKTPTKKRLQISLGSNFAVCL